MNIKGPAEHCSEVPGLILSLETDYPDIFNVKYTRGMLGASQFRICHPVPYLEMRKTIRNLSLPVASHECATWLLTVKKEYGLWIFENIWT
jgi:hypothetical protein